MNNRDVFIFSAIVGAGIGALAAYHAVMATCKETLYELSEAADRLVNDNKRFNDELIEQTLKESEAWYKQVSNTLDGYSSLSRQPSDDNSADPKNHPNEFVYEIDGDDYGNFEPYNSDYLYYYVQNGCIYDSENYVVEDTEGTVGCDFTELVKQHEDDMIYIRNVNLMTDYEVVVCYGDPPEEE